MIVFGSHFIRVFYLFIVIYSDIQNGVPVCIISSVICIFTQDMFDEYGFSTFFFVFAAFFVCGYSACISLFSVNYLKVMLIIYTRVCTQVGVPFV